MALRIRSFCSNPAAQDHLHEQVIRASGQTDAQRERSAERFAATYFPDSNNHPAVSEVVSDVRVRTGIAL
jgi:hypothetical protein